MVIWFVALKFTNTSWALLWMVGTQYYYWPDRIRWNFQGFLTRTMEHLEPRFIAILLLGLAVFWPQWKLSQPINPSDTAIH